MSTTRARALSNCPACQHPISARAKACPSCGEPGPQPGRNWSLLTRADPDLIRAHSAYRAGRLCAHIALIIHLVGAVVLGSLAVLAFLARRQGEVSAFEEFGIFMALAPAIFLIAILSWSTAIAIFDTADALLQQRTRETNL